MAVILEVNSRIGMPSQRSSRGVVTPLPYRWIWTGDHVLSIIMCTSYARVADGHPRLIDPPVIPLPSDFLVVRDSCFRSLRLTPIM